MKFIVDSVVSSSSRSGVAGVERSRTAHFPSPPWHLNSLDSSSLLVCVPE